MPSRPNPTHDRIRRTRDRFHQRRNRSYPLRDRSNQSRSRKRAVVYYQSRDREGAVAWPSCAPIATSVLPPRDRVEAVGPAECPGA